MDKNLICIVCPRGCHLKVSQAEGQFTVCGNFCKRGISYGINEVTHPVRKVTSTVKIEGAIYPRLPVITDQEISKDLIFKVMDEINRVTVKAPINLDDVIIENILDTNVNVVASRSMDKIK